MITRIKNSLKNAAWVFFSAMGIEAFTFKIPYCIVLGFMLISIGFIFFPWLDKILSLVKVKFSSVNKWFILVISFFISAYLITPEETNYYKCILPILMMILLWVFVIIYLKFKKNKF